MKREMVFIPAGESIMGTSQEEVDALAAEYGVHPSLFAIEMPKRTFDLKGFLIDRYPVTNAQYMEFLEATGRRAPFTWPDENCPEGQDDYPVTGMGWRDANAYAEWAGKRLPTAEEWEKAARGTDGRVYPWGNEWNDDACWVDDPACPQALARTTPVGAFPKGASPYGVTDLCGNVAEWTCTDSAPPNEKRNWHWYVVKGAGGAHEMRYNFRCAARAFSAHESRRHNWLGFRCAMDADEDPGDLAPPRPTPLLPAPPTAPGPDLTAWARQSSDAQSIQIVSCGGHGATLKAPQFPVGHFGLNVPEQVGAKGLPLGWGIPHEPFQWQRSEDGTRANYQCVWKDKATLTVTLECHADVVDLTLSLRNLSNEPLTNCYSNVCFNPHGSPYFVNMERTRTMAWTDDGPVSLLKLPQAGPGEPMHGGWSIVGQTISSGPRPTGLSGLLVRYPFIFIVSRDGEWTIAPAYREGTTIASNAHYSCLHTRPIWPQVPAGEERTVLGKLYFIKGGPDELLRRWRADFGVR